MTQSLTGPPIPQRADRCEDTPMSKHSLVDPCPPAWPEALTSSGSFLPIGSVVPISVLTFADDGTASDVVPQSTADRLADEIRAELDAMGPAWKPKPWPGPRSGSCGHPIPAEYGHYICTKSDGHDAGGHADDHRAHDTAGTVLASLGPEPTTALKPTVRKRPVRAQKTTVA